MRNPFKAIRNFAGETAVELRKATWPTRSELREYTIVVIIGIVLLGLFTSVADFSLVQVVDLFTKMVN